MNKVLKLKPYLPFQIRGIIFVVFAILFISVSSSCCVTGYCQVYDETGQTPEEQTK